MIPHFLMLSALSAWAATAAIPDERRKDLICAAVFLSFARDGQAAGDEERVLHSRNAAGFFLRRVAQREPALDVAQAMAALTREIGNRPTSDFAPACIEERMRVLEVIKKDGKEPLE